MKQDEIIIVGKINGFHGVKGFVKIFSETRPREAILNYSHFLLNIENRWQNINVEEGMSHGRTVLMRFESYPDRTSVEPLLGAPLAIYRSQLPDLAVDEFYWLDLFGLQVMNQQGEEFGIIDSMMETGANDVLVVKDKDEKITYIPYVYGEIVLSIDKDKNEMIVDWSKEE